MSNPRGLAPAVDAPPRPSLGEPFTDYDFYDGLVMVKNGVTVRTLQPEEHDPFLRLTAQAFYNDPNPSPDTLARISERNFSAGAWPIAAFAQDGEMVGISALASMIHKSFPPAPETPAYFLKLAVAPGSERQGIGSTILGFLECEVEKWQASSLMGTAFTKGHAALFEKFGYQQHNGSDQYVKYRN